MKGEEMQYNVSLETQIKGRDFGEVGQIIQAAIDAAEIVGVKLVAGYTNLIPDFTTMQGPTASTERDKGE